VKVFEFLKLSYPVCSQIWLNCVMDDHHLNDIAKMEKKGKKKRTKNKTLLSPDKCITIFTKINMATY